MKQYIDLVQADVVDPPTKPSCKARATGIGFDCLSRQAAGIPCAVCPACAEIHPEIRDEI